MINLLYGYERVEGGVLAMGIHLAKSLDSLGIENRIIKIGKPGVKAIDSVLMYSVHENEFASYLIPESSVVVNLADLYLYTPSRSRWGKINEQIFASEVPVVIHDAKCFTLDHRDHTIPKGSKYILCRKAVYDFMVSEGYKCRLVPYPYCVVNINVPNVGSRPRNAVCHARIAPEKGIETILEANAILPESKMISLIGGRNMMFVNFRLRKEYPNWDESFVEIPGLFDYHLHYSTFMLQGLLMGTNFCVDLTYLPHSGSSIQYTFLEAMSAGCHLVLNRLWIQGDGDMVPGVNCTVVGSPEELASVVEEVATKFDYLPVLNKFLPERTVPAWMEVIHG